MGDSEGPYSSTLTVHIDPITPTAPPHIRIERPNTANTPGSSGSKRSDDSKCRSVSQQRQLRDGEDVFTVLKQELSYLACIKDDINEDEIVLPFDMDGGTAVGYFGYEMRHHTLPHPSSTSSISSLGLPGDSKPQSMESKGSSSSKSGSTIAQQRAKKTTQPAGFWLLTDRFIAFDHLLREIYIIALREVDNSAPSLLGEVRSKGDRARTARWLDHQRKRILSLSTRDRGRNNNSSSVIGSYSSSSSSSSPPSTNQSTPPIAINMTDFRFRHDRTVLFGARCLLSRLCLMLFTRK
jgi:anthranilate/para-aminobenzoate synthase component I